MKNIVVIGVIALFIVVGFTSGIGVNVEQTINPLNVYETAWWRASECDGTTLYDCSGHNYDGTIYGADWTPGCCLDFDGVDDYVDLDNHSVALGLNKTNLYIIVVEFKSIASGMIYSMSHTSPDYSYFNLELDSDGKITVSVGDSTGLLNLSTTGSYNDGNWHLVEMYFEGARPEPTLTIYVDDELDGSKTDWMPPMIDVDFLTAKMGRKSNDATDYFDGIIEEVRIYKWCGDPGIPCTPEINGPNYGKSGQTLTYTFNAVDPEDSDVRFHIDWGDATSDITSYVASGIDKSVSHIWNVEDTYTITAYAEDECGNCGPSSTFKVKIPRDISTNNMLLLKILERFPLLQKLRFGIYNN